MPKSNSCKAIPFHFKTLVHSCFPGFNLLLEGTFWDLFEFRRRGYLDGIDVRKMGSLQNRLDLGEEERVTRGQIITERLEAEPHLLNTVITGDETWVFEYEIETKRQSREWKSYGSPRPLKARKSKVKVMLIVFFDI